MLEEGFGLAASFHSLLDRVMELLVGLRDRGKVLLVGLRGQGKVDMGRIAAVLDSLEKLG